MMKFFAALLCVFTGFAHAEPALLTDLALPYLAAAPADTQDKPLIIFLHGYGSDERDLFGIKDELSPDYTYLSVRAPLKSTVAGTSGSARTPIRPNTKA